MTEKCGCCSPRLDCFELAEHGGRSEIERGQKVLEEEMGLMARGRGDESLPDGFLAEIRRRMWGRRMTFCVLYVLWVVCMYVVIVSLRVSLFLSRVGCLCIDVFAG